MLKRFIVISFAWCKYQPGCYVGILTYYVSIYSTLTYIDDHTLQLLQNNGGAGNVNIIY